MEKKHQGDQRNFKKKATAHRKSSADAYLMGSVEREKNELGNSCFDQKVLKDLQDWIDNPEIPRKDEQDKSPSQLTKEMIKEIDVLLSKPPQNFKNQKNKKA